MINFSVIIPFICGCKLIGCLLSFFLYKFLLVISAKLGKDQVQIRDDMRSIRTNYPGRFFVVENTDCDGEICAFIATRLKTIDGKDFNEILSFRFVNRFFPKNFDKRSFASKIPQIMKFDAKLRFPF